MTTTKQAKDWKTRMKEKESRINSMKDISDGKFIPTDQIINALEKLIQPGDRVVLEGNNQKQASFLSEALSETNPKILHDLHMILSSISRPEHLDIFERGIANKIDFAYAGPQSQFQSLKCHRSMHLNF